MSEGYKPGKDSGHQDKEAAEIMQNDLIEILQQAEAQANLEAYVEGQLQEFEKNKNRILRKVQKEPTSVKCIGCIYDIIEPYQELQTTLQQLSDQVEHSAVDNQYLAEVLEQIEVQRATLTFEGIFTLEGMHARRMDAPGGHISKKAKANTCNIVRTALQAECIKSLLYHKDRLPDIAHKIERSGRRTMDEKGEKSRYEQYIRSTMAAAETVAHYNQKENTEAYVAPATMDANHKTDVIAVRRDALEDEAYEQLLTKINDNRTTQEDMLELGPETLQAVTYVQVKSLYAPDPVYERFLANKAMHSGYVRVSSILSSLFDTNENADPAQPDQQQPTATPLDEAIHLSVSMETSELDPQHRTPMITYSYKNQEDPDIQEGFHTHTDLPINNVARVYQPLIRDRNMVDDVVYDACDPGSGQANCDVVLVSTGEIGQLLGASREQRQNTSRNPRQ